MWWWYTLISEIERAVRLMILTTSRAFSMAQVILFWIVWLRVGLHLQMYLVTQELGYAES